MSNHALHEKILEILADEYTVHPDDMFDLDREDFFRKLAEVIAEGTGDAFAMAERMYEYARCD